MSRTIKSTFSIILERVKIIQLKNNIRKMESSSYLNLFERMKLRDNISLLKSMEQHQQEIHSAGMFSLQ